ncbi:MAG: tetratricopeptide repeat protein [Deltaproteobacteria bacterium]|nr:tetratricopeptide repeat protein [Deltaproteobacteria bacterium]MBI2532253.1 tetratricopeptide repeat protein [Deltaproteobacteria bacterium]
MAGRCMVLNISVAVLYALLTLLQLSMAWAQAPRSEELQAAIFVDRAVLAYGGKRYDEALKELQQALSLYPQSVDALYYQGLVYLALDRPGDALASLEKARAIRPGDLDVAFQLGVLYFSQKEYEKAEPLLRQVHLAEPRRPNIGYYLGFMEYRKKNYREALSLLRANVPSDDNFAQLAGFYTGLAVAALGFPSEARAEIDQALRLQPASPLVTPAQRFGEILQKAEKEERVFRGELRLGVYYDTNVPVVPNPNSDITATTIRQDTRRRKSEGELANVNLAYTWLKNPDWEGNVSYRFLQTYNNHLTEFNTQSHTPTLSIANRGSVPSAFGELPYDAGLQLAYDFISLGNAPFTQRGIVSPYLTVAANSWNFTTLQYRFQLKDFYGDDKVVRREVRDAKNYMIGPSHVLLFEEGRHFVRLGYQYDAELAEGENWSYRGHRLVTGLQYTLPRDWGDWGDIRLRYDLDFHWRFHKNRHSLLPATATGTVKRRDQQPTHIVGIAKDFLCEERGGCQLGVALEYLYDKTNSNLAPFDYTRHVVTTSFVWRFGL